MTSMVDSIWASSSQTPSEPQPTLFWRSWEKAVPVWEGRERGGLGQKQNSAPTPTHIEMEESNRSAFPRCWPGDKARAVLLSHGSTVLSQVQSQAWVSPRSSSCNFLCSWIPRAAFRLEILNSEVFPHCKEASVRPEMCSVNSTAPHRLRSVRWGKAWLPYCLQEPTTFYPSSADFWRNKSIGEVLN